MNRAEVIHRLWRLKLTAETTKDRDALDLAVESLLQEPKIVRCKDCGRYKTLDCAMSYEDDGKDYWWNEPDDYCSWGERIE